MSWGALCCILVVGMAMAVMGKPTTPPSGIDFPPPSTVTKWTLSEFNLQYSYTYKGYKLMGPFFTSKNTKDAQACFKACYDWSPKDPNSNDYCRSWTFQVQAGKCSLSKKSGCTVYNVNPAKECVLWDKDAKSTSGWVVTPLQ